MKREKAANRISPDWKKTMAEFIRMFRGQFIVIALSSLAGAIMSVLVPGFLQKIVDEAQKGLSGNMDMQAVRNAAIASAVVLLIGFVCNIVTSLSAPAMTQKIAKYLRKNINDKTNRIPLSYFDTNPEGETLSTMVNDVDTLSTSLGNTLPSVMRSVTMLLGCVILMFVTNIPLALVTIGSSVLGMILSAFIMKKGSPYFKKNQDLLAKVNSMVNESIKGHLVIKSFGAEPEVIENYRNCTRELQDSSRKSQFIMTIITPVSAFTGNLGYIAVCTAGAALVMSGKTSVGVIAAFIQYVHLFSNPLSTLTQAIGNLQPAFAAGKRVTALLDQEDMTDDGKTAISREKIKGEVEFKHVRFGYVPQNIIIKDFSLQVKPGQKIAIVGSTGAGKSTLVNLLMRFYEISGGSITIDGIPVTEMSRYDLHDMIGMVLQDTWTFEGTVRENIVYSTENVSEERFEKVCKDTGLDVMFSAFENGYDTMLNEESGISAGQKQLITIARAMLKDSPVLILDEATSSVDTRTEKIITSAIDTLMEGRTSFVIAHRLSTIRNADLIIVLKDGDIVETGNHDILMNKNGYYSELYLSQFDEKYENRK